MSWYTDSHDNFDEVEFLLGWLAGDSNPLLKAAQVWNRNTGGFVRTKLTDQQQSQILKLFDENKLSSAQIAKLLNLNSTIVRSCLIRHQRIMPNINTSRTNSRGLINDENFINKVLGFRNQINPATGKPWAKDQIAKKLDVSYQLVDRVIAENDPRTMSDFLNYVAYKFYDVYRSGMQAYMTRLDPAKRPQFVSDFIDGIFKNPAQREQVKEALWHKMKFRDKMLEMDPSAPRSSSPDMMFDRDVNYTPDMTNNATRTQSIRPNVQPPTPNGAYESRLQKKQLNPKVQQNPVLV